LSQKRGDGDKLFQMKWYLLVVKLNVVKNAVMKPWVNRSGERADLIHI